MKSPANLHLMNDEQLTERVRRLKTHIVKSVDLGRAATTEFDVSITTLQVYEQELRLRGYDPSDTDRFGVDVIGRLIQLKLEEVNG